MSNLHGTIICVLLAVIAGLLAAPLISPSRFAPSYEYRIEDVPDQAFDDVMDKHGAGGWDLVFARRASGDEGKTMNYEVIFKRPK